MSEIALRIARPEDADTCAKILRAWINETPWIPVLHSEAEDSAYIAVKIEKGWVTLAETPETAGFLTLEDDYISSLYIAPKYRRAGVGKRLLDDAKSRSSQLSLWTFQANIQARRFYMREGFSEARRTENDNEEKLPDVEFIWSAGET